MSNRWYFVEHPNLGVTAKVLAPTPEKARTAYLDLLERSGQVQRKDRQALRRNIMADNLDTPDSIEADYTIPYGYVEPTEPLSVERVVDTEAPQEFLQEEPTQEEGNMTPLQKLVLTGRV